MTDNKHIYGFTLFIAIVTISFGVYAAYTISSKPLMVEPPLIVNDSPQIVNNDAGTAIKIKSVEFDATTGKVRAELELPVDAARVRGCEHVTLHFFTTDKKRRELAHQTFAINNSDRWNSTFYLTADADGLAQSVAKSSSLYATATTATASVGSNSVCSGTSSKNAVPVVLYFGKRK